MKKLYCKILILSCLLGQTSFGFTILQNVCPYPSESSESFTPPIATEESELLELPEGYSLLKEQASRFVPEIYLTPLMDMIERMQEVQTKRVFKNIFIAHATAHPFSDASPFYQYQDKSSLIEEMQKLSLLITPERYDLLFDYLRIIATFGGNSVLMDSDRSLKVKLEEKREDYRFFLDEIMNCPEKNPLNFLALYLKMAVLLQEKPIIFHSLSEPPYDAPFLEVQHEFEETHSDLKDFKDFLLMKLPTKGTLFQREFGSIHGISRYFPDFIPLPFMGDLDAGDIVRSTPNGFHKLWLTSIPVHPVIQKTIPYSRGERTLTLYLNGFFADGGFSLPATFVLHDLVHLTMFASSFYIDQISASQAEKLHHRAENLRMVRAIQKWMDTSSEIDSKMREFMAFVLLHESSICDPFFNIFQNNFRYSNFLTTPKHLLDEHYYAPLLTSDVLTRLKSSGNIFDTMNSIFGPIYRDLERFVFPYFHINLGGSHFVLPLNLLYHEKDNTEEGLPFELFDAEGVPFLSQPVAFLRAN